MGFLSLEPLFRPQGCDQRRVCGWPCPGPGVKASPCVFCKVLCAVSAAVTVPLGPPGLTVSWSTHPCDAFLTISSSLLPAFLPLATKRGSVIDSQDLELAETSWCWGEVGGMGHTEGFTGRRAELGR